MIQPEESRSLLRRFWPYLRSVWGPFCFSLVLLLLVGSLTAAKAWIVQPVVDTFKDGVPTHGGLLKLCCFVIGIFTAQAVLFRFYDISARMASQRMVCAMRRDLFGHLMRQSLGYFVRRPTSDLASRVVNDIQLFNGCAIGPIQGLLRDLVTVILLLTVLLIHSWQLAFMCLGIIALVGIILRTVGRRVRALGLRVQENLADVNKQLHESVGGMDLILSFGLQKNWNDRFKKVNESYYETQIESVRTSSTGVMIVLLVITAGLGAILYLTGSALLDGRITAGQFLSFLATMYLMQAPAEGISKSVANIARGIAAGTRALELLDESPALKDPARPVELSAVKGAVEFDRVSFSYAGEPILSDLSFDVEPGELLVMVGDSGAGKSTVAKLLLRFYDPASGQVRLDGVSVRDVARRDLHRAMSYVSQEVYLFDGSIEFNLRVGKPDATPDEIAEAVQIAGLGEFLQRLPDGLQTIVGERGVRLSGGQRQRIAIGRAILTRSPILVLDEATSALDMELEQRILQNLIDAGRHQTIFAITHRLSLAEIADRVLVLKEGRLVEEGRADVLGTVDGEYARLQCAARAKLVRQETS